MAEQPNRPDDQRRLRSALAALGAMQRSCAPAPDKPPANERPSVDLFSSSAWDDSEPVVGGAPPTSTAAPRPERFDTFFADPDDRSAPPAETPVNGRTGTITTERVLGEFNWE